MNTVIRCFLIAFMWLTLAANAQIRPIRDQFHLNNKQNFLLSETSNLNMKSNTVIFPKNTVTGALTFGIIAGLPAILEFPSFNFYAVGSSINRN